MRIAQTLDLGGMTYEIDFITSLSNEKSQIIIEFDDSRLLSEIAADFEGRETIIRKTNNQPEISTTYSGFTELIDIRRNQANQSVRITLKKP